MHGLGDPLAIGCEQVCKGSRAVLWFGWKNELLWDHPRSQDQPSPAGMVLELPCTGDSIHRNFCEPPLQHFAAASVKEFL